MKDKNTVELTLIINGGRIGFSGVDITITLEITKPLTSGCIISSLRTKTMHKMKENSACSICIKPQNAERTFYNYFGQQREPVRVL